MERLVESVDLEAHRGIGVQGQQGVTRGTEDDGLTRYREVDRQHHDPRRGREPDATDAAWFKQFEALGRAERPQRAPMGRRLGGGLPAVQGAEHVLVAGGGVDGIGTGEGNAYATDDGDAPDCGSDEH